MSPRFATLCVALVALAAAPGAGAGDRQAVWTVQGRHNTVYLFGSVHVLRPGEGGLSPVVENAYADAEQLVMEIDMDDPEVADPTRLMQEMQGMALLPRDLSLRDVLGADYDAIRAGAARVGLDLAVVDRFAPWFVATLLLQLDLARRGFLPELGIEQRFANRAADDGKPILGLETAGEQFALLGALPLPQQKRFLLMALEESAENDARLEELLAAWRSGDTGSLASLMSAEFDDFPELYRPLTEDRNRAWVARLVDLLDDRDDYLVVVGALHLVGRNSVVDLLRERGYRVTQH